MADRPAIVPYLSYEDGRAAIAFLEKAFGFETVQAYDGDDGALMHAELRYGNGVVMLGTAAPTPGTVGIYLVVDDVDGHFEHAKAAGAYIVYPPEDTPFGTRRYRAKDSSGYEWSFGSYQPQTEAPAWG